MSIKNAYNSWANQYDTNENKTRDLDQKATIKTLSELEFKTVLELGCGTGKNTEWLVKHAQKVIGLDFSEEMLAIASTKITSPKVDFIKTDLNQKWEVPDKFADLITCSLTLEHIKNLSPIFEKALKKIKDRGIFFICELHPIKQYLGSKARYESERGVIELEVYTHHISEYIDSAQTYGFKLIEVREWFDTSSDNVGNSKEIPRLISFIFKK